MTLFNSANKRAITGSGVPFGTNIPFHPAPSTPDKPASASVGTSGMMAIRLFPATPKAFNFPDLIC